VLLYKEFKIAAFDSSLATTSGIRSGVLHYLLMAMVAVTAVASFETVGNILVVAMFVVPPATALLLTDRLGRMLLLAPLLGVVSAVVGHTSAIALPRAFGMPSVSTAGMMAVAAGILFTLAAMFSPRHGVVVRNVRRLILSQQILGEDILGTLYRAAEINSSATLTTAELGEKLLATPRAIWLSQLLGRWRGFLRHTPRGLQLTETGASHASDLVRSHRLWEQYLDEQAGVASERLHASAERLEHYTDLALRRQLDEQTSTQSTDPHGREIPPERQN
jgi:manganese/zinc/iron transport system permease protein